jgi:tetratricopeptide (TPR) repeat protein
MRPACWTVTGILLGLGRRHLLRAVQFPHDPAQRDEHEQTQPPGDEQTRRTDIRLDPKHARAYYNRGIAWERKGEYDKAITDYTESIRLDPKHGSSFLNRGNAWDRKGEDDNAIRDYTEAIRLNPKHALAFQNRARVWERKGEDDKAIADYAEAIRLSPKDARARYNRGVFWEGKGRYENAIKDYDEAIRLDPKYSRPYNNRAWVRATCPDGKYRDGKAAVEDAKRACELSGWKLAEQIDTLAAAYAEVGDFAKAVEYQEKALADKGFEKEHGKGARERLELYRDEKPYREPKK